MARLGVDSAEVERVGNSLTTQANQLYDLMNQIGILVSQAVAVWEGNDALQFQDWPLQRNPPRAGCGPRGRGVQRGWLERDAQDSRMLQRGARQPPPSRY